MPAIGIDLGTTYSRVAIWQNGTLNVISNDYGNNSIPSYVSFGRERLIGDEAKDQAKINPENTIFNTKRLFGQKFQDVKVQEDISLFPFEVRNKTGEPEIKIHNKGEVKTFSPEKITSFLLKKMKEVAEIYLRAEVREAVITVPNTFTEAQCKSVRDIATTLGLKVLNLTKDPNAAAIIYAHTKNFNSDQNILIYDFGGGKLNVSILTIRKDGSFEVKASSGDPHLGGQDFDNRLIKYLLEKIKKNDKEIVNHKRVVAHIYAEAERVKKALTSGSNEMMKYVSLYGGKDFQINVSRDQFEEMCAVLFDAALLPVKIALKSAKMDKSSIDDIILVGGSSRIPKVQSLLKDFFKGKPLTLSLNADLAIVQGAALHAAALSSHDSDDKPLIIFKEVDLINFKNKENKVDKQMEIPEVPEPKLSSVSSKRKSQSRIRVTLETGDDGNLLITSEGINVLLSDDQVVSLRVPGISAIREFASKILENVEDPSNSLDDSVKSTILYHCGEIKNALDGDVEKNKRKSQISSNRRKKKGPKNTSNGPNMEDSNSDWRGFRKGKKNDDCILM